MESQATPQNRATSNQDAPKKGVTPPKGRPTRARNGVRARRRVFGPVAQWIAVALALALVFVVVVIITDGGDFNPFNDGGHSGIILPLAAIARPAS